MTRYPCHYKHGSYAVAHTHNLITNSSSMSHRMFDGDAYQQNV